jgi:hypothetical protein
MLLETKREKRGLKIGHIGSGTDCWRETRMAKMSLFFLMKMISPYPTHLLKGDGSRLENDF